MKEEVLDIFDAEMNWIGTATRPEVHRAGLWHQTFHCWVVHQTPDGDFLVLQRRHSSKDTHPNKLDISAAGHLEVGERPPDGVRELREELGIAVAIEQLYPVGMFRYADRTHGVQDNEFCHVFVLVRGGDDTLDQYQPAVGEISGLYAVGVTELQRLCYGQIPTVVVHGFEMDNQGRKRAATVAITLNDLVPYARSYYEMVFEGLRRAGRPDGASGPTSKSRG